MSYTAIVGTNLELSEYFTDDYNDPLDVAPDSLPTVRLVDPDRVTIFTVAAYQGDDVGEWNANIPIPDLNLAERTKYKLIWTFQLEDGIYKYSDDVYLEPSDDERDGDIVVMEDNPVATIKVPVYLNAPPDTGHLSLYKDNNLLDKIDLRDPSISILSKDNYTLVTTDISNVGASVNPYFLSLSYMKTGMLNPKQIVFNAWVVNASILSAATSVEDFINKARIQNVIPELDYQTTDLLEYLRRGLNLFNTVQQITAFTGLNMQGVIRECWVICATYYALAAQLQAEGAMSFDFSGQTVNLNIDRTGPIESALGRIEGQIDSVVKPAKVHMLKAGVKGGDGNTTAIDTASNFGRLGVSNACTTKIAWGRGHRYFRRY